MSLVSCRECGEKVSDKAEKCPSCGIKNPSKAEHVSSIISSFVGAVFWIFIGLAVIGFFAKGSSKASCELISESLNADVFFVEGEPDAGFRYDVRIKNGGEKGDINLKVRLSTSEGEFERKQEVALNGQQLTNLSFNFHEPTVNATNVQAKMTCSP